MAVACIQILHTEKDNCKHWDWQFAMVCLVRRNIYMLDRVLCKLPKFIRNHWTTFEGIHNFVWIFSKYSCSTTCHGGAWGERRYSSYCDLCTRWGWVVSVTPRPRFTPGERTPGTNWIGGWVSLRAGLDTQARGKVRCLCRGSNPDRPVVQSV
jgi:hypothetical protein